MAPSPRESPLTRQTRSLSPRARRTAAVVGTLLIVGVGAWVVTLPMPRALFHEAQRLPASYANFYIANGVVLLPTYDAARDEEARRTLQELFPTREVIGIDCTDLVWGLGAFHCVSQQWPAV